MIKRLGFTVIEFIIVIGIIFFLAAALLPALSRSRQMAKKRNAREVIYQLEVALQMYGEDYGTYPTDGTGCGNLITWMEREVGNGPYCEWPDDMKDGSNLLDPWGESYRYRYNTPTVLGTGIQYNIWSDGPDKEPDTDDDVTNW